MTRQPLAPGEVVAVGDEMRIGIRDPYVSFQRIDHANLGCRLNPRRDPAFDCGHGGHVVQEHEQHLYWRPQYPSPRRSA